ncbi:type V toxin-antitoxin system endoribonuclease antitoxin GhoS [Proteus mirabilis]
MAMFIVRVELPDANYSDYQALYDLMESYGFSKQITGDNGVVYNLPDAEYYCNGDYDIEAVSSTAFQVAQSVRANAKVLVTEAERIRWTGLVYY